MRLCGKLMGASQEHRAWEVGKVWIGECRISRFNGIFLFVLR